VSAYLITDMYGLYAGDFMTDCADIVDGSNMYDVFVNITSCEGYFDLAVANAGKTYEVAVGYAEQEDGSEAAAIAVDPGMGFAYVTLNLIETEIADDFEAPDLSDKTIVTLPELMGDVASEEFMNDVQSNGLVNLVGVAGNIMPDEVTYIISMLMAAQQ